MADKIKIQRGNTVETAHMEEKATVFNEAINSQRRLWEVIMSELVEICVGILGDNIKLRECTVIDFRNPQNIVTKISNKPLVYYLGGSGYASYNRLITENGGKDVFTYAPRTHDWDTSFVLKSKKQEYMNNINTSLLQYFRNNYDRINVNNYIEKTFEQINLKPELENKEELVGLIGPAGREYIEITLLKTDNYQNFRFNLVKKVIDKYEKNHIGEFVFWFKKPMQKIYSTVRLIYNDTTYYLTKPIDLLKSNLESLMNRSINPTRMAKCRQDYLRITNFIDNISIVNVKQIIPTLVDDLKYITEFLEKIRVYIPQCMDNLDSETYKSIEENLKHIGKTYKLKNMVKVIKIFYEYYITRIELERKINKMSVIDALNPDVPQEDEDEDEDEDKDEDGYYYFKNKYLKYKQKYLNSK
jgi:hypothetical protein